MVAGKTSAKQKAKSVKALSLSAFLGEWMLKTFAMFVAVWGLIVSAIPWILTTDHYAVSMIITGLGLVILASSVSMWRKAA